MAKITGIGGVFFKSKGDPKALAAWYQKHLGLPLEPWGGAALKWPEDRAEDKGVTAWHVGWIGFRGDARPSDCCIARCSGSRGGSTRN